MMPTAVLCEFWGIDSVKTCDEAGAYKMTYVGHAPYINLTAQRLCKRHYELMASIIMHAKTNGDIIERRRAERTIEINNWFQHE